MPRPPLSGPSYLLVCLVIATQAGAQQGKGPKPQAKGPPSQVKAQPKPRAARANSPGIDVARGEMPRADGRRPT